jgi:hypothetical protein
MISSFDSKLVALIASHPSTIVGTCDRACVPCIGRAYGTRVYDSRPHLELMVSRWPGPQTQANLEQTGRAAITFTSPSTFEAYQVKGKFLGWDECTPDDLALSEIYTKAIREWIVALQEPLELARVTFTPRGLFRISIEVDSVFVQTPGRNAGQRL